MATLLFSTAFTDEGPVATTVTPSSCQSCVATSNSYSKKEVTISQVVNQGQFLILSDNSVWKIKPSFWIISGSWIMPIVITVETSSSDSEYPYHLKNNFTNETIQAKKSSMEEIRASEAQQKSAATPAPVSAATPVVPEATIPTASVDQEPISAAETK